MAELYNFYEFDQSNDKWHTLNTTMFGKSCVSKDETKKLLKNGRKVKNNKCR